MQFFVSPLNSWSFYFYFLHIAAPLIVQVLKGSLSSTPTSIPPHFQSYIHNTRIIHCSLYTAHLSFSSKNGTCTRRCAVARFPRKFCRSMYLYIVMVSQVFVFLHHFVSHVLMHYYYDRTFTPLLLHRSRALIIIFVF